jgi:hypothetical protein
LFGLTAAARRSAFAPAGLTAVQPLTKPYIAAGAAAAFFVRRVFRRAFFAPLRRVFLAAPRAPALRTVRFFLPFDFRFDFFAVIGM